jgi:chorismate lyase/3-hydroxybenzoate synthase
MTPDDPQVLSSAAQARSGMADDRRQTDVVAGGVAGLSMAYEDADRLEPILADEHVLAAFGFGDAAPLHDDPRWLRVPLQPLGPGPAPVEVWRSTAPVRRGRDGALAWASDGRLMFGALELEEGQGGIEHTASQAYAQVAATLAASATPHLLRMWNYLDAITLGEDDDERYRQFCVGRARGLGGIAGHENRLPAATAIGRCDGKRRLQVYWLAAASPGLPVENPRQVSAYRYPRQYGPQPPSFARAMLPSADARMPLLISGTAAIVGHHSLHEGRIQDQVDETLANLQALVDAARVHAPGLPARLGPGSMLKAYVRHRADAAEVAARLPASVPHLLLHAQVCRRELLVEIDGLHGLPAGE